MKELAHFFSSQNPKFSFLEWYFDYDLENEMAKKRFQIDFWYIHKFEFQV